MSAAALPDPVPRDSRFDVALAGLRREVAAGRYRDRDMLPGEREMSEQFGVSRTTLRRVLAVLVEEGLLSHRQGVGTFVRRTAAAAASPLPARPEPVPPARLTGFSEDMRLRGLAASSRDIERGIVLPTPEEAMMLACSPGERVVRLSRIRYADDLPMVVDHAAVPHRLLGDPEEIGPSLYATLARRGLAPVRALQRVQAVTVSDLDAERLGVPRGSAALHIRRTAYLADGRCCEYTRSTYRSDRYDVVFELGGGAEPAKETPR